MKKASLCLALVLSLAAVLVLGSCQAAAAPNSGNLLMVDGSNHLLQDAVYTGSNWTETYGKDGSYQTTNSSWDTVSSTWKQTGGEKGTYTWNSTTFELTKTVNARYSNGQWVSLVSGDSWAYTDLYAFSEHAMLPGYAYAAGVLTSTYSRESVSSGMTGR